MIENQKQDYRHHPNVKDIAGQQFGDWTVMFRAATNVKGRNARWLCKCKCGSKDVVLGNHLRTGKSTCCRKCAGLKISKSKRVHGQSGSRTDNTKGSTTYRRWMAMRARSASNKTLEAMRYAKMDIECCSRWSSYQNFLDDMGPCPSEKHTLDRENNNLGYCKSNCRWATQTEQQRNKSSNRIVEFMGAKMCVSEFAERIQVKYSKVAHRVRRGWSTEQILAWSLNK